MDITQALEDVAVPAYLIDPDGRFQWLNRKARELIGDVVGSPFSRVCAPEDLRVARTEFARKVVGHAKTEFRLTVMRPDGRRTVVEISSVPLVDDGVVVGVFGLAYPEVDVDGQAAETHLTARQFEALALLADGLGTQEVAERLGVAEDTARNHIRALLKELDVHSRLEAVVKAHRLGLLPPR